MKTAPPMTKIMMKMKRMIKKIMMMQMKSKMKMV